MPWPLHRKIGIGITLIGIAPLAYATYLGYSHDWEPLRVPVLLTPGEFRSPEFKTDLNGRYLINLSLDRLKGPDFDRAQCMMGVNLPSTVLNCDGISRTVGFDWQVVGNDGKVIQSGSYAPLAFSSTATAFAEFQGKRGGHQTVVLKIRRDAGAFNAAHPKLVVEVGPEYSEGLPEWHAYSVLWAKTVGVLGLLWILLPFFSVQ